MKIGFIWHVAYPWDVRLEKMVNACVEEGHQVSLLCKGKHPLPIVEQNDRMRIDRVYPPKILNRGWLGKLATFPLFFNPFWFVAMLKFLRLQSPDMLIVRDLPLAYLAGLLGRWLKIPVFLDMAENYPAALIAYRNPIYKPFLIGNSWLPRQYEKLSLKLMSHAFVVTKESADRLEAQGIASQKLTVVGNTPDKQFFTSASRKAPTDPNSKPVGLNLLFVGKIDAHRGVDLLIKAVSTLLDKFPNLTLTIVGDGTERVRLQEQANSLGLGFVINFTGWVEFLKIWDYIEKSTVCLIPHLRSEHTDTTLPNKLFDYMAMGKPVVVSNCVPMKRIVRESDCGLIFETGDVCGLRSALQTLLADPMLRAALGQNGKRAVHETYNWDVDRKVLLGVIGSLPGRTGTRQSPALSTINLNS